MSLADSVGLFLALVHGVMDAVGRRAGLFSAQTRILLGKLVQTSTTASHLSMPKMHGEKITDCLTQSTNILV
jgi:hypothetical protein